MVQIAMTCAARHLESLKDYYQLSRVNKQLYAELWLHSHELKRQLLCRMDNNTALMLTSLLQLPPTHQQRTLDALQQTPTYIIPALSDLEVQDMKALLTRLPASDNSRNDVIINRCSVLELIIHRILSNPTDSQQHSTTATIQLFASILPVIIDSNDQESLRILLNANKLAQFHNHILASYFSANPQWFISVLTGHNPLAFSQLLSSQLHSGSAYYCLHCQNRHSITSGQALVQMILSIKDDETDQKTRIKVAEAYLDSLLQHHSKCHENGSISSVHNTDAIHDDDAPEWNATEAIEYLWKQSCIQGDLDVIEMLVDRYGFDLHWADDFCMRWACRSGHLAIVKYLLLTISFQNDIEEFLQLCRRNNHPLVESLILESLKLQ